MIRVAVLVAPLPCAAYGLAAPDSVLGGGFAWLVALAACLVGWGHLAMRATAPTLDRGDEIDLGLLLAWGTAGYLAVAGIALAAGVLCRPVVLALIAIGLAGFGWRTWTRPDPADAVQRAWAWIRGNPNSAAMLAIVIALAGFIVLAAIARTTVNVYDDDVIYTPLIKRLLEVGNLDEPFSFRRISSYGGQTVLSALMAARGTLASPFAIDAGLFQVITLLLVAGIARGRVATSSTPAIPPVDRVIVALVLLAVLLLPQNAVNTASYWTGVAMFLGVYRTAVLASRAGVPVAPTLALASAVAASAATLRQSYLAVGALAIGFVLSARLLERATGTGSLRARVVAAWRGERQLWLWAIAGGALVLMPWCVATWRSNETFLFPFQHGTFNPEIQLTPTVMSGWQELQMFVRVVLQPDPLRVYVMLIPLIALARDLRAGRPVPSFALASAVGFAVLIHSFTLSDSQNLWRYTFGYTFALAVIVMLEAGRPGLGKPPDGEVPVVLPVAGRIALVVALLIQIALSGPLLARRFAGVGDDLDAAINGRPDESPTVARGYADLQAAVPSGAPLVVMLDEPAYLDYTRNPIINLDEPGFASWRPGMPFFRGAEPVAAYFLEHGVRHIAFVRGERSRYLYRRDEWVRRLLIDTELWRVQAAYLIDCVDNLEALASSRAVLFERDGLVVVDLAVKR
ncbi:MAG: hypothetical protein AB7P03_10815 [Kofleriaceae bacterium]